MLYSPQSKTLLYETDQPLKLLAATQGAQKLGKYVAVPATLTNCQELRRQGQEIVPLTDVYNYDFPIRRGYTPQWQQIVTTNFLLSNPKCFCLNDMGCVDAETEYLSPTGWKRIDQYKDGPVAQYHLDGHINFAMPIYVVRPCETMLHFKTSRGVDQMLSEEHRVLYVATNGARHIKTAADIAEEQDRLATGFRGKIINTFSFSGKGLPLTEAQLRLQVAVIADGSFPRDTNYCVVNVKKERKKERMRQLLSDYDYKEHKKTNGYSAFTFQAPRRDKEFTDFYWAASSTQLSIVADEAPYWDGSRRKAGAVEFYSKLEKSASFVQFCFAASGRSASMALSKTAFGDMYVVHARRNASLFSINGFDAKGHKTNPVTRVAAPGGKKYCFEVPTGFLILRRNGNIFATGNTMKTLSALWAADFLMMEARLRGEQFRAIIVSPLSTLEDVWWEHIHKNMLGRRKCIILHGSAKDRQKKLEKDVDFYIINPDGLKIGFPSKGSRESPKGLAKDLSERVDIKLAIFDEASVYRNANTPRHKAGRLVSKLRPYVWAMTGTPTPKGPENAYGIKKLIHPDYPESYTNYKSRVMLQVSQFKWVPKYNAAEQAAAMLQPAIRIPIEACWQLPPCTKVARSCDLSHEQSKAFNILKRDAIMAMQDGSLVHAVNEAVLRMKLLQVVSGCVYDEDHQTHLLNPSPRIALVREIIDNCAQKVIIAAHLTNALNYLNSELADYERVVINGSVSVKDRREILLRFGNPDDPLRVVLVDPATAAHGLNSLVTASVVIWYTPTDNPEHYQQLNKRIDRPGQTAHTTIVQIAATPIEREIFNRLDNQQTMQGVVLQLAKEG